MTNIPQIFNRPLIRTRRQRAAANFAKYNFLKSHIADLLIERLQDMNRTFDSALDLGCHHGELATKLKTHIPNIITCDSSPDMLKHYQGTKLVVDNEQLPFAKASFDLITSALSLHTINDLPGTLHYIQQMLKPNGLFIAAMFGGDTLRELRTAFLEVESKRPNFCQRVAPFVEVKTLGSLLQRAGFELPVTDSETITVTYPTAFELMQELKAMGESNPLNTSAPGLMPRGLLSDVAAYYQTHFGNDEGGINATFEVMSMTGLCPMRP